MRLIFFGTAELACASLAALTDQPGWSVVAVVSQPDRPKGRDLQLQPTPVKHLALQRRLPVLQPLRAKDPAFVLELANLKPDLIVVAAYGQILPRSILDLPPHGCLNVHTSLLPKYRGAAPIQWALLNDEPETGVTIMKMDAGLDTGDILLQQAIPIAQSDNAATLHDSLAALGAALLVQTIPPYLSGSLLPRKQPEPGASYARKISKEDGRLDWSQPARTLWNRVRAFTPWPGAWTFLAEPSRQLLLKIWTAQVVEGVTGDPGQIVRVDRAGLDVACGQHGLRILTLQREGGRRLPVAEFLTGHAIAPGQKLA